MKLRSDVSSCLGFPNLIVGAPARRHTPPVSPYMRPTSPSYEPTTPPHSPISPICFPKSVNGSSSALKHKFEDDDCFYYHSWRNNVVIAFGTLSSFLT